MAAAPRKRDQRFSLGISELADRSALKHRARRKDNRDAVNQNLALKGIRIGREDGRLQTLLGRKSDDRCRNDEHYSGERELEHDRNLSSIHYLNEVAYLHGVYDVG